MSDFVPDYARREAEAEQRIAKVFNASAFAMVVLMAALFASMCVEARKFERCLKTKSEAECVERDR